MSYDLVIIGGGPGGYHSALRASSIGKKVLLIEKDRLGGTCLNRGCIPTKALLHSAKLYKDAQRSNKFGIRIEGVSFDTKEIYTNKDDIVTNLVCGLEGIFKSKKIEVFRGQGSLLGPGRVALQGPEGNREIQAERILIATGSRVKMPPIEGIESPGVLSSNNILEEPKHYNEIIIVGGGVIGVELASYYNYLGSQVTILEYTNRLIPAGDKEVSRNLTMIFKKRGIQVITEAKVSAFESSEGRLRCHYGLKGESHQVQAEAAVVAIGRQGNTEGLFADGVKLTMDHSFITVDKDFQTSMPGVYAIGDVIGGTMLAHTAYAHGESFVSALEGKKSVRNLQYIPSCIYSIPEISSIGLSEEQAKKAGISVRVAKYVMGSNSKSLIEQEERGFIKLLFNERSIIVGATLMCGRASDLITEFSLGIQNNLTYEDFLKAIRPHPSFSEGITEALHNLK